MLTLAIGDLFIPDRAIDIPAKFRKLLAPIAGKPAPRISEVLCLGNITNSLDTLKFLHGLSPSFHLVRGEFDDSHILAQQLNQVDGNENLQSLPSYKIIQHGDLKIGFTNGFQIVPKNDALSLASLALELDVDILIWGGTHKVEAYILDGKFFINPGSATGAFSLDWAVDDGDADEDDVEEIDQQVDPEDEEGIAEQTAQLHLDERHTEEPKSDEVEPTEKTDEEEKVQETSEEANVAPKKKEIKDDESFTDEDININEINNIPSFCLLDTNGSECTLYIYTYLDDEVKVDKVTYNKKEYT